MNRIKYVLWLLDDKWIKGGCRHFCKPCPYKVLCHEELKSCYEIRKKFKKEKNHDKTTERKEQN